LVRDAWISWAIQQPNPKPSWLVHYAELSEADKEADRMIGERVAKWVIAIKGADWSSFVANPQARASSPAQDERSAFEAWWGDDTSGQEVLSAWNGWQARASSPAPSGEAREVNDEVLQHARDMVRGHYPSHREFKVASALLTIAGERIDRGSEK
jgi:hypothetical protein